METIKPELAHKFLKVVEKRIGNQVEQKKVCAGDHLIRQGQDPLEMFVLLKGEIRIYYATTKGDEYLFKILIINSFPVIPDTDNDLFVPGICRQYNRFLLPALHCFHGVFYQVDQYLLYHHGIGTDAHLMGRITLP